MDTQSQLADIQNRLSMLEARFGDHSHTGLDSPIISGIPLGLVNAPLAAITRPTGGATQDIFARQAINTIIDDLKTLTLTN